MADEVLTIKEIHRDSSLACGYVAIAVFDDRLDVRTDETRTHAVKSLEGHMTARGPLDAQGLGADRLEPTLHRPGSAPDRPELPPNFAAAAMVAEERLRRQFPDEPTHPNQAYAAARRSPP